MNPDNDLTLQAYNDHLQDYVAANKTTVEGSLKAWIDKVLELIPKGGKILEIGSGYGRDAAYMDSLGYQVTPTDAAESFVELLNSKGLKARKLNALTDDFGTDFDLVFAQAVFLHFTPGQLEQILKKSFNCLKSGGILAFSVKEGRGEGWSDDYLGVPRYFCFWEKPELQKITETASFQSVEITERRGTRNMMLHVVAKK